MNRDQGLAGLVAVGAGSIVDLVAFGGDALVATAVFVLADADVLVTLFNQLLRLAPAVDWLPESRIEKLYYVAVALFVLTILWRALRSWSRRRRDVS